VRSVERDVHEERPVAFRRIVEETDCVIGHNLAPVLASLPESLVLRIRGRPRVGLSFERAVVRLGDSGRHAAAHVRDVIKSRGGIRRDVPLSRQVRLVSRRLHPLGPEQADVLFLLHPVIKRSGSPHGLTGDEHRPAGDADGAVVSAHVVSVGEHGSLPREPVEMGRLNLAVPEFPNRGMCHVVRKEEEDVGPVGGGGCRTGQKKTRDVQEHSHSLIPSKSESESE
jgi:hypothetical protein